MSVSVAAIKDKLALFINTKWVSQRRRLLRFIFPPVIDTYWTKLVVRERREAWRFGEPVCLRYVRYG